MNLKDFLPKNIGEMSRVVSNPYAHSFAPFKEEDLDEELKEGFGGELKGAAKRKFETERKKNAEVLGYKMVPEASVTGNLDGGEGPPKTPYAFQSTKKKRKKDKEKEKKISTNSTGYTIAEDIYVALVSKTGRQFTGKQPRFNPRNLGHPGLLVTTADKIFKSEVGRNLSQKLASKLKITKRYNQKGLQGSKKTADRGTRQYIDAIGGVIKSKMVPEIPNGRTMPVTKRLDLVFANSQSQLDNVLKGKYKVVKESVNEKVNKSDLKYQLDMSLDNLGIGTKALIVMKPKGKDFFLKMKSYMYQDSMEAVLKDANKNLDSKLKIKDFKKTRMGTEFIIGEGTCGYGIDGKIGEEPAGPNLMKKIKKISKDKEKKKLLKSKIKEVKPIKLKGKSGMGKISHLGVPQPSKGVEKLFRIADKGFDKVGGVTVDGMSASLFKQIYNKANDDIKSKLNKKSEKELVRIIGRMWDKFGKNVKIGSSL